MSRILVTGGGGQLGSAFRTAFRPAPRDAVVLGRSELDVTDRRAVTAAVRQFSPQIIVNCAAYTRVDAAEADPDGAYRVNALGARYVAEAAESAGAWLVQVSTDYVYPGDKAGPYLESDKTGPLSVYGKTKLAGEVAAKACSRTLIVRTSWVFGDGQNFIRSILNAARKRPDELTVVSDQHGLPTYAPHLADGIIALTAKGLTGIYHLAGSGPATTWAELAEHALAAAGLSTPVRRITTQEYAGSRTGPFAPRPPNSVLDCSKAARQGIQLPPWPDAVAQFARYCIEDAG